MAEERIRKTFKFPAELALEVEKYQKEKHLHFCRGCLRIDSTKKRGGNKGKVGNHE